MLIKKMSERIGLWVISAIIAVNPIVGLAIFAKVMEEEMIARKFIMYITACGHVTRMPVDVKLGFAFSCLECRKVTTIVDVHVHEYHATCKKPKCRFSAWTGLSQDLAEQAADRHARNAVNHAVFTKTEYVPNPVAVAQLKHLKESHLL